MLSYMNDNIHTTLIVTGSSQSNIVSAGQDLAEYSKVKGPWAQKSSHHLVFNLDKTPPKDPMQTVGWCIHSHWNKTNEASDLVSNALISFLNTSVVPAIIWQQPHNGYSAHRMKMLLQYGRIRFFPTQKDVVAWQHGWETRCYKVVNCFHLLLGNERLKIEVESESEYFY